MPLFRVSNFGPIEEAEINLNKLTVFVGPNMSGKSYMLYLMYTLLTVEPNFRKVTEIASRKLERAVSYRDLETVVPEVLKELVHAIPELLRENLMLRLCDVFLVLNPAALVRHGAEVSEVLVRNPEEKNSIRIVIAKPDKFEVELDIVGNVEQYVNRFSFEIERIASDCVKLALRKNDRVLFSQTSKLVEERIPLEDALSFVVGCLPHLLLEIFDYTPLYPVIILPDGRAGLTRVLEVFTYTMLRERHRAVEWSLTQVDIDFVSELKSIVYSRRTSVAHIADFIEARLGVKFTYDERYRVPVIEAHSLRFRLEQAPSGLRELAPLVYLIRHKVDRGHIVMIEEPETHLHPDAQSIVTRALVELSKHVLSVVFTTHSIHVLDELNTLIKLSKLSPEEKRSLGYEEYEGISHEDVSIYNFRLDGTVSEVEVSEDGLSATSLDEVLDELAGRYAKVASLFRSGSAEHLPR